MTLAYTTYFRFAIPDFLSSPWHADWEALVRHIDRVLYGILIADGITVWANSHVYAVGDLAVDQVTGEIWQCLVAHTSAVTPTTFSSDRVSHPSYWQEFAWSTTGGGGGGTGIPIYAVTASNGIVIDADDEFIIFNKPAPAASTVSLPAVATRSGLPLFIADYKGNAGDIVITPFGTETIMGYANWTIGSGGMTRLYPVDTIVDGAVTGHWVVG